MPVLQHPRPRHAYIPDWQTATEFDMKQFVKDASSPAPPDAPQPPRYPYDAAAAPLAAPSFSADAEEEGIEEDELILLADAQTSGGLLVVGEVPGAPVIGETVAACSLGDGALVSVR